MNARRLAVVGATLAFTAGCADSPPSALGPDEQEIVAATGSPGPVISLWSNILGKWQSGEASDTREMFAGSGIHFAWSAEPGKSGAPIVGFGYAVDDTSEWSPTSPLSTEWPLPMKGIPQFWFPEAGVHAFYVRAFDEAGNVTVLSANFVIFDGPRFCSPEQRFILVVLDTNPAALVDAGIWPGNFAEAERARIEGWFEGYDIRIHETGGSTAPAPSLMNCASSTFWFHSTDVAAGDRSVLQAYHSEGPNVLPSYVTAGGNFFLCGLRPSEALRYFESTGPGSPAEQPYPVDFELTIGDPDWVPHWTATELGVGQVRKSIGTSRTGATLFQWIVTATSSIGGGANPYPDLPWDPARWPPPTHGFGYFDLGVIPREAGETIYELNESRIPIAARRLTEPGINGNTSFVGFHPFFVEESAFGDLVTAVLSDFGETGRLVAVR